MQGKIPTKGADRREFRGNPASPGIVIGEAFVITTPMKEIPLKTIPETEIAREVSRFRKALKKTRQNVLASQKSITKKLGKESGRIFDAHLLILEDDIVIEETVKRIKNEQVSADYAFFKTVSDYLVTLREVNDDYLREREADIRDVKRRVITNLKGIGDTSIPQLNKRVILIAHELTPSMTAGLTRNKVIGVATDVSGRTSHAVIFARSLEIPSVVGLGDVTQYVNTGDRVILDGIAGVVINNPGEEEIEKYKEKVRQFREFEEELSHIQDLPAMTVDGYTVHLSANIEIPLEIKSVITHGAKGVGLFRTEFLFLDREDEPGEEEQYEIYSEVLKKLAPYPVVIRTFDLGGDKYINFLESPEEMNPYLGWRAIRISLECESIFRTQLRAILRSSVHGNLRVMFPMISCVEELEQALDILKDEERKLREEGVEVDEGYETGIMIEIPAAAMIADILAKKVDFFSIGTNDLIQYAMAADRDNARVAHLYQSFHPGVIRLVKKTIDAAKENGIWVATCGEMGGNPLGAVLLVGLGIDELSVSPVMAPEVKTIIRAISLKDAQDIAASALKARTQDEVMRILTGSLGDKMRELYIM